MKAEELLDTILLDLSLLACEEKEKKDIPLFWIYTNLYNRYMDIIVKKKAAKNSKNYCHRQREARQRAARQCNNAAQAAGEES